MNLFKNGLFISALVLFAPSLSQAQSEPKVIELEASSEKEINALVDQKIKDLVKNGFEIKDSETHKIVVSEEKVEQGSKKVAVSKGTGKFKRVQVQKFQLNIGKGVKHVSGKQKAKQSKRNKFGNACSKLVPKVKLKFPKFEQREIKETVYTDVPFETKIPEVVKFVAEISYDKPAPQLYVKVEEEKPAIQKNPHPVSGTHHGNGAKKPHGNGGKVLGKKLYNLTDANGVVVKVISEKEYLEFKKQGAVDITKK